MVKPIYLNTSFTTSFTKAALYVPSLRLVSKGTVGTIIQWTFPPQTMFVTVTGDRLILNTRRFTIYILMVVCVTSPSMLIMYFVPPYMQWWQIPCYWLSYLVMGMTTCTFSTMFESLFRAGTLLNSYFKVRKSSNFI